MVCNLLSSGDLVINHPVVGVQDTATHMPMQLPAVQ
jgi:hypothetical protein